MDPTRMKSVRAGNRAAMTKLFRKLDELNFDTQIDTANPIIDAIKKKQDVITKLDEQILENTADGNIEHEITDADEYNIEIETNLRRYEKLTKKSLNTQNCPSDSEFIPTLLQTNSLSSQNHRLPKLTLPTFAGNILEWQYFWDSFETTIHTNQTLTDVQKFSYLKSLLTSEANNVISGLTLSSSNYHNAVELLINRYGQNHKIVNAYMKALLDLPAPFDTLDSLRNFSYKSEAFIRGLESLGQCQETYGSLLIPIVLGKLPTGVRRNITRENGSDNWTLVNLKTAIQKEISILEASQTDSTNDKLMPTTNYYNGISKISETESNDTHIKSCFYCAESHFSADCCKITECKSRWEFVRNKKACYNYLGNHTVSNCRSKHNCRICRRRHHTSLCNTLAAIDTEENYQSDTANDIPILHSSSMEQNSAVFLKTAVASVLSNTQCSDACILFDEGAQRSFITQDLAEKLNVKIEGKEALNITAFGDTSTKVRVLNRTKVKLRADSGSTLPLPVLIVPTIAAPLRNPHQHFTKKLRYLQGLKLAQPPSKNDNFEISLLIGADHYWDVVKDEIIRGNGPTAMNSEIGFLLSGSINVNETKTPNSFMMHTHASHVKEETNSLKRTKLKSIGHEKPSKSKTKQKRNTSFSDSFEDACFNYDNYFLKQPWYG